MSATSDHSLGGNFEVYGTLDTGSTVQVVDDVVVTGTVSVGHAGSLTTRLLGGTIRGGPAAASASPGELDVAVRGTDDAVYFREGFDS